MSSAHAQCLVCCSLQGQGLSRYSLICHQRRWRRGESSGSSALMLVWQMQSIAGMLTVLAQHSALAWPQVANNAHVVLLLVCFCPLYRHRKLIEKSSLEEQVPGHKWSADSGWGSSPHTHTPLLRCRCAAGAAGHEGQQPRHPLPSE